MFLNSHERNGGGLGLFHEIAQEIDIYQFRFIFLQFTKDKLGDKRVRPSLNCKKNGHGIPPKTEKISMVKSCISD